MNITRKTIGIKPDQTVMINNIKRQIKNIRLSDLNHTIDCLYVVKQANYNQLIQHYHLLLVQQFFINSYKCKNKLLLFKESEQCSGSLSMHQCMQSADLSLFDEQISDNNHILKNQPQFVIKGFNSLLIQLLSQVVTPYIVRKAFQWK